VPESGQQLRLSCRQVENPEVRAHGVTRAPTAAPSHSTASLSGWNSDFDAALSQLAGPGVQLEGAESKGAIQRGHYGVSP